MNREWKDLTEAAQTANVEVVSLALGNPPDFAKAFAKAAEADRASAKRLRSPAQARHAVVARCGRTPATAGVGANRHAAFGQHRPEQRPLAKAMLQQARFRPHCIVATIMVGQSLQHAAQRGHITRLGWTIGDQNATSPAPFRPSIARASVGVATLRPSASTMVLI